MIVKNCSSLVSSPPLTTPPLSLITTDTVAVPVASAIAVKQVEKVADRVVTCTTGFMPKFYVSDFYRYWNVLSDEEGLECFQEWQRRRYQASIKPPKGK